MDAKGIIFDIKKFAVHDGPGIRTTVFFKGCPLRCLWCHNPEGIAPAPEIMVFASRCLKSCRDCLAVCPHHALAKRGGTILLNRALCDGCGACAEICPSEALQLAGRTVTVEEIMTELEKDRPFYQNSAGGVTFSGGEPLSQPEFLRELLIRSRKLGIRTVVDTSGLAPYSEFEKILPYADLFLYDLKAVDNALHQRLTGASNRLILENLRRLSRTGKPLSIRIPLIPGCNDSPAELARMADFCAALPGKHTVHLLPYHHGYSGKIKRLDLTDPLAGTLPPAPALVQKAKGIFTKKGLNVKIGG